MLLLTPPLASSLAYEHLETWRERLNGGFAELWWLYCRYQFPPLSEAPYELRGNLEEEPVLLGKLKELLRGRLISEQRLVSTLRQRGYWPSSINHVLDLAVVRGEILQIPGFTTLAWGRKICARCQSNDYTTLPCPNCGDLRCCLCLSCLAMGEHRGCSTLLALKIPPLQRKQRDVQLHLEYALTKAQALASQDLLKFWRQPREKALIWAACGAGKTEVTFSLIQMVLAQGGEVLFAIPRQDIVREMAERLGKAFPNVEVAVHYGGQPWQAAGPLVVATTHQVLHFYERFQLAILDEVDAFPYQGSDMLRSAMARSLVPGGRLVEMTATPQSLRLYDQVITIPARYHGRPLPEPQLISYPLPHWTSLQRSELPALLVDSLKNARHPWLVFAPTIAACDALQGLLQTTIPWKVGICHSKVSGRERVIELFRRGQIEVMVTTSVLERGVTFPNVGVIVLYAEHQVFSTSTLVQMAGRVGRSAEYPHGPVLFIASRLTTEMRQAKKLIQDLNQEAQRKGLLDHEAAY